MKLPLLTVLLGASCFSEVVGHAKLISPTPRGGVAEGRGTKMRPFDEAGAIANAKMSGGKDAACPGPAGKPTATYTPGQTVTVKWSVTIPHERDRKNSGVRIALRYDNKKGSFRDNILAGYVKGDPKVDGKNMKKVDAGKGETESYTVTLPKGKTCESCTLQWMWAAERDGGFYLGCADIAISDAGSSARRRRRSKTGSTRRRRNKTGSTRRRRAKKGSRRRRSKRSGSTRRRRMNTSKSGKVKAKACADSKPQKCRKACKPLMCPPKQCAMRMDSCCDLKCQEPK